MTKILGGKQKNLSCLSSKLEFYHLQSKVEKLIQYFHTG